MDVRAKQRLCLLACPLNFSWLGGGFAPRHLKRYMLSRYKACMKKIILSFILLLFSANLVLAKDPVWLQKMKQVKLLSDTYEDVVRIMGKPDDGTTEREYAEYFDLKEGRMFVLFEMGCRVTQESNGKLSGYKVPEYTVVELSFSPEKNISPKKSFINLSGFTKIPVKYADDYSDGATPDDHRRAPFLFEYRNDDLGIYYFEEFGKISDISFYPAKQFDNLLCSE